jgi:hypothetical protein
MAVLIWQVAIFTIILLACKLFGRRGLAWSTGLSAIWTVVMIFTSWLMILQFVTIAFAGIVGAVVCDNGNGKDGEEHARNWRALVETGQLFFFLSVFGGAFLLYKINPEHFRNFDLGALDFCESLSINTIARLCVLEKCSGLN